MKLQDALTGVARLGLDTAPLIYLIEDHPRYAPIVLEVSRKISIGEILAVTSVITLGEVLVQPFAVGNLELRRRYRDILLNSVGVRTCSISAEVPERAAELRARFGMRLPDALQVAVAIDQGCEAFLTNDRRLGRVNDLHVLVLDDLELE